MKREMTLKDLEELFNNSKAKIGLEYNPVEHSTIIKGR